MPSGANRYVCSIATLRAPSSGGLPRSGSRSRTNFRSISIDTRARRDRERVAAVRSRALDAGGRIGVVLVERLVLQQGLHERVEPVPVLAQQLHHLAMRLVDDAAH